MPALLQTKTMAMRTTRCRPRDRSVRVSPRSATSRCARTALEAEASATVMAEAEDVESTGARMERLVEICASASGGGRRCRIAGCKSSSESGGLCYSHGGGRRCSLSWCNARAKKGGYCATHIDNRDAAPPSSDTDNDELKAQVVSGDEDTRASTAEPSVHPQVIETLLSLSKSSSGSESGEDGASMMSPTSPAGVATTSRQVNPYAIASILN
ncbi:hypothetical protein PINS_up015680 [Pythium insidiosum]|nr:hypothetical protein PINS_up015680 [Pythium insidiosum]